VDSRDPQADLRADDETGRGSYFDLVYDELRRLAQSYLRSERPEHTLQATALVHEAYLRLSDRDRETWKNRAQFFAAAARAMRRILVDHARARASEKRHGRRQRLSLDQALTLSDSGPDTDLLALDLALTKLKRQEPEKVAVVELRFFAGLTADEAAEALGVTPRTVFRHWEYAKAWLYREMTSGPYAGADGA
jgi:RNA polymerase sigma factor (TIGR02999 family)